MISMKPSLAYLDLFSSVGIKIEKSNSHHIIFLKIKSYIYQSKNIQNIFFYQKVTVVLQVKNFILSFGGLPTVAALIQCKHKITIVIFLDLLSFFFF